MAKPRKEIGNLNIVGARVAQRRKELGMKQKELMAILQVNGMDIGDSSMSRLEGQNRKVLDYELPVLSLALQVTVNWLLGLEESTVLEGHP